MTRTSKTKKAGLIFSVAKTRRKLKQMPIKERISDKSAVCLAATMEYIIAEVADLSGQFCRDMKLKRIRPRHIMLAMKSDSELSQLVPTSIFPHSGVVPKIHKSLLPKKRKRRKKRNLNTKGDECSTPLSPAYRLLNFDGACPSPTPLPQPPFAPETLLVTPSMPNSASSTRDQCFETLKIQLESSVPKEMKQQQLKRNPKPILFQQTIQSSFVDQKYKQKKPQIVTSKGQDLEYLKNRGE